jgi:hypothetical protein
MNTETKYILYAVGGIGAVMLIIFSVNMYRKMQAAKRMQMSPGSNLENLPIDIQMKITGTADWNNSTVKTNITFGDQTWAGDINPTVNKTETKNDQEIRITGGATNTTISLIKRGTVLKSANIDFYNERLNGFN